MQACILPLIVFFIVAACVAVWMWFEHRAHQDDLLRDIEQTMAVNRAIQRDIDNLRHARRSGDRPDHLA